MVTLIKLPYLLSSIIFFKIKYNSHEIDNLLNIDVYIRPRSRMRHLSDKRSFTRTAERFIAV